jgi:glucose/arabinose dehydrogenase
MNEWFRPKLLLVMLAAVVGIACQPAPMAPTPALTPGVKGQVATPPAMASPTPTTRVALATPAIAGMTPTPQAAVRRVNPADIQVPEGFKVEAVASGLSYVTSVAFDDQGQMYVGEAGGHTYGTSPDQAPPPRILRIKPNGPPEVIFASSPGIEVIRNAETDADIPEGLIAPITGLTWHDGLLYVTHRTRVSTLNPETGEFKTIIRDLPAWGEFQNNKVIFTPDGRKMVFFVSTQTNSAVVDDHMLKVLTAYNKPDKSEVACEDVTLTGQDFVWENPFTPDPDDRATYDAYVEFGRNVPPGTTIQGKIPCNGAFFRANPDGTDLELIAWGLRSNFGYRFSEDGRLITTMNSGNPLPPREIFDDWETIWEVKEGEWYGWPDYYSGLPVTDQRFRRPTGADAQQVQPLDFVLTEETRNRLLKGRTQPIQPLVRVDPHVALEGMVFGRPEFGMGRDDILVAEFGTVVTYLAQELPGFRVQRINLGTGQASDFLVNKSGNPASATGGGGLERPIQLEWGPDGALYVIDFGVIRVSPQGLNAQPNTGLVWKVSRTGQ